MVRKLICTKAKNWLEGKNMEFAQILEMAKAGNAEAQYNVGTMYLTGEGVEKNLEVAFKWLSKAANQ